MKRKFFIYGITTVSLISVLMVGYLNKDKFFYPKEGDEKVLMFDNSKPGKWVVSSSDKSIDGSIKLNESTKELCVTKEMIESAKLKTLKEKLGLSALDCSTIATRESKSKATFNTSCTGMSKEEAIGLSIDGEFLSLEDKGSIISVYTVGNGEEPFKFRREIIVARVGECGN